MRYFVSGPLAPAIGLLLGLGIAGSASAQALGCNITLRLRNTSAHPIDAHIRTFEVRSRIAGALAGPWRDVQNGGWQPDTIDLRIQPGAMQGDSYASSMLCQDQRQYRIDYTCRGGARSGNMFTVRLPERLSDWSTSQTAVLRLGDYCN